MSLDRQDVHLQESLPFRILNWSCAATRSPLLGSFLVPLSLVLLGIGIFLLTDGLDAVTVGVWLSMGWASITFALLKYARDRIGNTFDSLKAVVSTDSDSMTAANLLTFRFLNDPRYYLASVLVLIVVMPNMYSTFISNYESVVLQVWATAYFLFVAFVGGYGMAAAFAFDSYIRNVINTISFAPQPFHPDLFMGLKPLGSLSVTAALLISSASLLFPLIFETVSGEAGLDFLGYLIFVVILTSILAIFFLPLFTIKNKIELEKFRILLEFEREYQCRLGRYKEAPTLKERYVLQMLQLEKEKLREIRLFPFETRMLFQVVVSILLPIVMLVLQIYFKK